MIVSATVVLVASTNAPAIVVTFIVAFVVLAASTILTGVFVAIVVARDEIRYT
jgi:hypothetical protein